MGKTVDLFMFMGQSNMAGRGITSEKWSAPAPKVIDGAGFEYRAISEPGRLFPIEEPFGVHENREGGINDGNMKTGSMVTSFVNTYYTEASSIKKNESIPIVGVSASKGGSTISMWQPGGAFLNDALERFKSCERFLVDNGYLIRHRYMLWCQGESDCDEGTSKKDYLRMFDRMLDEMLAQGIEKLFMVQIGRCNIPGSYERYDEMIYWQEEIAGNNPNVQMVSTGFKNMRERGLMKDEFHYYQQGYNEVGIEAARNILSM